MPKSGKTDVSKASQERLAHALLESAPDAMVVADRYGTIVIVNKQTEQQLFGYQRDELAPNARAGKISRATLTPHGEFRCFP